MVDKDRLDKLVGGSSDDGGDNKSKDKKEKSRSRSKKKKEKSKKSKLSELKGSISSSSSSSSSGSGGGDDIKRLLFTISNMEAYTRVMIDYEPDKFKPAHNRVKEDLAKDISGEITNFLGVFNIRDILDKYGYDWENILRISIENKDMTGRTLETNEANPSKTDIKDALDCIANIYLFVEGTLRDKQNKENLGMRDRVMKEVSKNMHKQYRDIISQNEVQKISEKYGYDWQSDIIEGVLTEQDFSSKLDR